MIAMIKTFQAAANSNATLLRRGHQVTCKILIGVGSKDFIVSLEKGYVKNLRLRTVPLESGIFAIRADDRIWVEHWQEFPKRNYHDLFSMLSSGLATIDGDLTIFMRNLIYFKMLLAAPRNRIGV